MNDKPKILILDDQLKTLGGIIKYISSKQKYTIFPTTSYEEALRVIKNEEVDVFIVDYLLNNAPINGDQIIEDIRKEEARGKYQTFLPCILITASKNLEYFKQKIHHFDFEYVTKSSRNLPDLIDKIDKCVDAKKLRHKGTDQLIVQGNNFHSVLDTAGLIDNKKENIIERKDTLCVLKADIKGFSHLMELDRSGDVSKKLSEIVNHEALKCRYFKAGDGDSIQIVHHDPHHLVKVAHRISEDLLELPEKPLLRIAIDCSEVRYEENNGVFIRLVSGTSLRTSARLEPCVIPGQTWITEPVKVLLEQNSGKYQAMIIIPENAPHLEHKDGKFNIKKSGSSEDDFFLTLYQVVKRD